MDVERIRETLAVWDSWGPWDGKRETEALAEAARLVVEARECDYCRRHDSLVTGDEERCEASEGELPPWGWPSECDSVPARLLVPPKGET